MSRNRKWTHPFNRPLATKSSPKKAQTFKPIGESVPMGYGHNPLSFRRRLTPLGKWLRLERDHTPCPRLKAPLVAARGLRWAVVRIRLGGLTDLSMSIFRHVQNITLPAKANGEPIFIEEGLT